MQTVYCAHTTMTCAKTSSGLPNHCQRSTCALNHPLNLHLMNHTLTQCRAHADWVKYCSISRANAWNMHNQLQRKAADRAEDIGPAAGVMSGGQYLA